MKRIFKTFILIILMMGPLMQSASSSGRQQVFKGFNNSLLTKIRMVKVTPFNPHCYDKGLKRRFSSMSSQCEQPHKDEPKWRKEEFYSPTFWVRLSGASVGIMAASSIAWWTYRSERNQEEVVEHIAFLSKTRDYMNEQLKENNELFSQLFADAVHKQGIFQHSKPPYEREKIIKKYLILGEKIERSLKYYDNMDERLNITYLSGSRTNFFMPQSTNRKAELITSIRVDLKMQRENLVMAKYINKYLFYMELENHTLAKKSLERLISIYLDLKQNNTNDKDARLSTFYNLKALASIKEAHLTSKSKDELVGSLKKILEKDLNVAEKLDFNNPHVYEHKFFLYLTLAKYEKLAGPQAYKQEMEENATKCYSLAPKNPASLNVMGLYKFSTLNYLAAINYFEMASTLTQNYPPLLHNLAKTHLSLGRKNQPHYLQTALEYAGMAKNLSHDYRSIGIYVEALAECGKCQESYHALDVFKEVCADSIACKRGGKLENYEKLVKEKCKG